MATEIIKKEMNTYYRKMDPVGHLQLRDEDCQKKYIYRYNAIFNEMDTFYSENPNKSIALLKSRLHTLMAKYCEPVLFDGNPFFFELGYNNSLRWGLEDGTPACWLEKTKRREIINEHPWLFDIENQFSCLFDYKKVWLCGIPTSFDMDHNTLGYTALFKSGIKGMIEYAKIKQSSFTAGSTEHDFCAAVIESCEALVEIAHKFAEKAALLTEQSTNPQHKKYYEMIAKTAQKIPENPPESFYEGLAMLIFTREVIAVMDNIGISQLGHVDRLLGNLYKHDLETGKITESEARELINIWMLHTDIKFDLVNREWPETSTCIELGGCDEYGNVVYNDVTKMFIEEHHKAHLVNPKLNCRYSENSPDEYLKAIAKAQLAGHNNFCLLNDNEIIAGLMEQGVEIQDARLYVNGGCQETMIEGFGHTEGAGVYVSFARLMDLFLREDVNVKFLKPIKNANDFDDFYTQFLSTVKQFLSILLDQRNYRQSFYKNALCCPLFSATQKGCIENGTDFVQGGAKYNFTTIALVGLANVIDSLYAIKTLVYEHKEITLQKFIEILNANWCGYEEFHKSVINLPKYAHNVKEVDLFANKLITDVSAIVNNFKNERGGNYITSFFVYRYNRTFAGGLRATPDGRRNYEYMAASCSPSTLKALKDITAPIKSMQNINFSKNCGGINVLDMMLPSSKNFAENEFVSFVRACNSCHCVALQPNVASPEELLDAKVHPENHKNLIVRICGLSAYFITLTPEVQDEIINRNFYQH